MFALSRYCRYEVHRRLSWAYSVGVLASAFAGVLAYALGLMDGIRDMKGWRWIFAVRTLAPEYYVLLRHEAN
jgi:MFS family permease